MLIGRLNAIKPSEQVDRMNMVRLMIIDGVVPCAARFIVELEQESCWPVEGVVQCKRLQEGIHPQRRGKPHKM